MYLFKILNLQKMVKKKNVFRFWNIYVNTPLQRIYANTSFMLITHSGYTLQKLSRVVFLLFCFLKIR